MVKRANWKGFLKFGEVTCPVALYTAASTSDRISFNILNRKTGNRVKRVFVDDETGVLVARDDQVKGYEFDEGRYIILQPEEVAAAVPDSDKTLKIEAFIPCSQVDNIYFDKPYYLVPDKIGIEAYRVLRDGMKDQNAAAIARTVLFRRLRTVLIRPHGCGILATTLNFDYEVRPPEEAFGEVANLRIKGEMLELAKYIISMKTGTFDISNFDDRYEEALAILLQDKIEGRTLTKPKSHLKPEPYDLLNALRESIDIKTLDQKPKHSPANINKNQKTKKTDTKTKRTAPNPRKAS